MTARRFSNAAIAHDAFLDVQEIQRNVADRTSSAMRTWTTQLPVFLTAVLARCARPEDLLEQIAWWRAQAAPYRAKRVELLAAVQDGNVKALKRIENAVRADIQEWRKAASPDTALAVAGSLLATGSGFAPAILTALKVLKAVSGIDSGARTAIINRITRRDQWFLTRLGDTAASLTNALPKVQRLWGIDDYALDDCAATLQRMRALDPTWPVT